ncbi:MAG: sulfate transporter CysZ [Nitrospirota bacterium]|nr:sulfate transporter CysZ [Nitrospirota bacterium]
MKGNPFLGAGYLLRGFSLIFKPELRSYVVVPLLINIVLFSILIVVGAQQFNRLVLWLLPEWLVWLKGLLWPLFALTISGIAFFTFLSVCNLIGAPFNGLLAERVENRLRGCVQKSPFQLTQVLRTFIPALISEVNKILYFALRALPLLALFLIPGVNIIAPVLWMIFSAWILALEYADFPMANHDIRFTEQRILLQKKRLMVWGFGAAVLLLIMIPVVNFIAMPTAVAGATAMWLEQFDQNQEKNK